MGKCEVIYGNMFAGKSEELLRRLRRHQVAGRKTILLRPDNDTRYDLENLVSHSGYSMPAESIPILGDGLLIEAGKNYDVIGIDEIQFFAYIEDAIKYFVEQDKIVIITGLDKDFRGELFENVSWLISYADTADKLNAVCAVCGKDATMTQRFIDEKPAPYDSPTILVGGLESYEARCRQCHTI